MTLPPLRDPYYDTHKLFDNAGILQLTWLLGNEPHLASVPRPELLALRVAGMFDIHMGERADGKVQSMAPTVRADEELWTKGDEGEEND